MDIYPSDAFEALYISKTPQIYASIVAVAFCVIYIIFFFFDRMVKRRNQKLLDNAARSNAVVTSLFPGAMRDKVMLQEGGNLKSFVEGDGNSAVSSPLAELYLGKYGPCRPSGMIVHSISYTALYS